MGDPVVFSIAAPFTPDFHCNLLIYFFSEKVIDILVRLLYIFSITINEGE